MKEIEKINEELRNYKLFKIQRAKKREQEFNILKNDIIKIQKKEFLNYFFICFNTIMIITFIYNCFKMIINPNIYYQNNKEFIIFNFILVIVGSFYFTYHFLRVNFQLKKHLKTAENAELYFINESENLKSVYEDYVNNYLQRN